MNRLSNLPNEIICHIASFLSAKEAVFTAVLSKRFQNLYNIIPNLEFDGSLESFTDFVDGVLALPASTRIMRFSLKCQDDDIAQTHYAHINHCLCDVLNRGVLDLELDMDVGKRYSLPVQVFTCKTVVKLKLGSDFVINVVPNNASLPALEALFLDNVRFKNLYDCAFEKLLSACIVLKELTINGMEWERWKWSGNVSSRTLQRLSIIRHGDFYQFIVARISLNTPSLTYLECLDVIPDEYPIVNLDSLVEAKLDLMLTVDHIYDGFVDTSIFTSNPTNLIKGLRNVQVMSLTTPNTFQTFYYFNEALPVFEKLHHLSITPLDEAFCWQFLPFLIKKAPNLETLTIDGPLHCDVQEPKSVCKCLFGYSFLLSCPLKVLQITHYDGIIAEVEQLKHFLEKLSCLELVKLRYLGGVHNVGRPSIMLPIAPSKCKIEVTYSYS